MMTKLNKVKGLNYGEQFFSIKLLRTVPHIILYLQIALVILRHFFLFYCNIVLLNILDYIINFLLKISLILCDLFNKFYKKKLSQVWGRGENWIAMI